MAHRWSIIAAQLPGRTDNDIKNYWNTKLKKKLMAMAPPSHRKPPSFPSSHQTLPLPSQSFLSLNKLDCTSYYTPAKSFSSFDSFEPISSNIPLHLLNNNTCVATSSSQFQIQENQLVSSMQYYPMKENFLTFGSEPSCSSSDGSCSQISYGREVKQEEMGFQGYYSNGFEENHKFMLSYGNSNSNCNGGENLNQWTEKPNGYFGETPPSDYTLEDVKQLISCSSINGCNNDNIGLFSDADENKMQEKIMYHCFNY